MSWCPESEIRHHMSAVGMAGRPRGVVELTDECACLTRWARRAKSSRALAMRSKIAAQAITSASHPRPGARRYLLVGLLRCGLCGRSLEPLWSHGNSSC
jgi:hypothetical protein